MDRDYRHRTRDSRDYEDDRNTHYSRRDRSRERRSTSSHKHSVEGYRKSDSSREYERDRYKRRRSRSRSRSRTRESSTKERRTSSRDRRDNPRSTLSRSRERPRHDIALVDANDSDAVAKIMGFGGFNSTKGQKVADNTQGAADIKRKRKYRQYLHVKGLYDIPMTKQQLEEKERLEQEGGTTTKETKKKFPPGHN